MRPRWNKVIADLLSHKIRSLLVIASIAVGLFAIGMITTVYVILTEDIRSGYEATNPANIQVNGSLFNDSFVDHIKNIPEVAEAEGAAILTLQVRTDTGDLKLISLKAQKYSPGEKNAIALPSLIEGSWPPKDKGIVLDINKINDIGASFGDELEIKLPSGNTRRMTVTGIVKDQSIGASRAEGGFFLSNVQGYITSETLTWLEQPNGYNTLLATVKEGKDDRGAIRSVADNIVDEFTKNGYITSGAVVRLSRDHPNVSYVDAMTAVIFILGFLVVFLSGFLITNTLSALLNQQVEQIGVMKTIGASRGQIIGLYMILILVFSLIALAISVPASNQASFAFLEYLSAKLNFNVVKFRTVPISILLQVMITVLVPQLAGNQPILQGTKVSVREALSGTTSMQVENNGFLYRLLSRVRGFSRPMLISLRNTLRRRSRLILTLITLSLGGATFIATSIVSISIENYINRLARYFLADVNLNLDHPYRIERVKADLAQIQGIKVVEGWTGALASVVTKDGKTGETLRILAPPTDSQLIEPMLLEGRWLIPGDQNAIALSELFHDSYPEIKVGDILRLKIGLKESDWIVVGFFQFAGKNSGLFAYTNYDYLSRYTGTYGKAVAFRIDTAGEVLNLQEQKALARLIEAHLTEQGYEINEVSPGLTLQESTSAGLNILTTFLLIMSFLLAAVGSIGLMGTMSLNVMERTREIGIMRAVGGSNRAITSIVLVEGVFIGILSWMLAVITAIPISKQLADVMFKIIFDRNADLAFTITGPLIWLGIVVLLSILSSVIPAYNASRLTIREVLSYE